MSNAPLKNVEQLLPSHLLGIVQREPPIPTIAQRAAQIRQQNPEMVRADIGQISGLDPELEIYYGPPVGLDELRAAIAETWNLSLGWHKEGLGELPNGLGAQNVAICSGAAEGLTILFHCFAFQKNVGLPRGHWENYTNGVEMAGGRPVIIDFFDEKGALAIDLLRRQIRELSLGLIVANFPCNPTGAVLNADENRALGALLEETGCLAIADEVYYRLRYDGHPPTSLLSAAPGHVVSVSSASKEYLLPGARVGYVLSAHADLTDRVLRRLIRANTASPNIPGQKQLLALLTRDLADLRQGKEPSLLSRVQKEMQRRRDLLLSVLEKHGFSTVGRPGHRPEGTIFLMAGLPAWWSGSEEEFVERALEEACVSVVPGSAFGLARCVRFSYGGLTMAQLEQLDQNLARFRARHQKTE